VLKKEIQKAWTLEIRKILTSIPRSNGVPRGLGIQTNKDIQRILKNFSNENQKNFDTLPA